MSTSRATWRSPSPWSDARPRAGAPIGACAALAAAGHAPGFCAQLMDVEVEPETAKVTILRVVTVQDAGTAIPPAHVEGRMRCSRGCPKPGEALPR